jgi:hypothetical protein
MLLSNRVPSMQVIGGNPVRPDAWKKVRGRAIYADGGRDVG